MKKNLLFIIIIFNLIGCSLLQVEKKYEDPRLKNFKDYYQNWQLNNAKKELDNLKKNENIEDINIQQLYKDIELRSDQKSDLEELLEILKNAMKENDFETIEKNIDKNLINKIKMNQLKKHDLSNVNIFIGKIDFYKDKAKTIIIFNYIDQSVYYNFEFKINDGKWILEQYEERG
ncbi:MAG: hypothetical protein ACQERZ_02260 [Fusobacteriota bacterium]